MWNLVIKCPALITRILPKLYKSLINTKLIPTSNSNTSIVYFGNFTSLLEQLMRNSVLHFHGNAKKKLSQHILKKK